MLIIKKADKAYDDNNITNVNTKIIDAVSTRYY